MSFFSVLEQRVRSRGSLLCVGLDPHPQDLSEPTPQAARDYCLRLVQATASQAAAFKPNSAFFEIYGAEGWAALKEVVTTAAEYAPVILDAKRGDIPDTARAYAQAARTLGAQAITASPYLGRDSLSPFLEMEDFGVFLLCKTSNPDAGDLQDLAVLTPRGGTTLLYEHVARLAQDWNQAGNLGLVVGATYPQALRRARAAAPDLWFLVPGVGAQGGDLSQALRTGLRADGMGMLVNVSRGVARSADPTAAAEELRLAINAVRNELVVSSPATPAGHGLAPSLADLADGLLEAGCVRFGQFTLKSGLESPIYIDLRRLVGYPNLLSQAAAAYLPILRELQFDRLAALPYAALPLAAAISLQSGWPLVYPRKETKAYGTKAEVEGVFTPGERVVVIDDLATTGGSKFEAIEKLTSAGLLVSDVVVLIDRQAGAAQALSQAGYRMHAACTLTVLLDYWEASGKVTPSDYAAARQFMQSSAGSG